ncbi:hypothetical protein ZMO01_14340 [Zymomonas mobilis subsp. mobilis]|nr:hypothetical protein ZMO01_14340 [Zymomonas mobilis subsp. mobilis]
MLKYCPIFLKERRSVSIAVTMKAANMIPKTAKIILGRRLFDLIAGRVFSANLLAS